MLQYKIPVVQFFCFPRLCYSTQQYFSQVYFKIVTGVFFWIYLYVIYENVPVGFPVTWRALRRSACSSFLTNSMCVYTSGKSQCIHYVCTNMVENKFTCYQVAEDIDSENCFSEIHWQGNWRDLLCSCDRGQAIETEGKRNCWTKLNTDFCWVPSRNRKPHCAFICLFC